MNLNDIAVNAVVELSNSHLARRHVLSRIYNSCTGCVHFDAYDGGFTVSIEEWPYKRSKRKARLAVAITGESPHEIDDVLDKLNDAVVSVEGEKLDASVEAALGSALTKKILDLLYEGIQKYLDKHPPEDDED